MAKIAYLVLTHGLPYQTIDFLWSIWREDDAYFVHVDRKSPAVASAAIRAIAAAYANIHVVPPELCTWGGFSLVEATLRCLEAALTADASWSHAVLVSATHFPLRRAASLAATLESDCCYMTFHDFEVSAANSNPPNFWSGIARRLTYEYQEVPGLGNMRGPAKSAPSGVTFYWGSQWWILSRSAAEFVHASRQGALSNYFRTSAFPDETYFQTMLGNSPLKEQMRHQQIIWQIWANGRPRPLSEEEIRKALTSRQFFARKASEITMRDESGILARTIASADRTSWVESVNKAFANYLPASMAEALQEGYRDRSDSRDSGLGEIHTETRSLINETSETIRRSAAEYGLNVQVSSSVSNGNEGMVKCEFPRALVHAHYLLIVRFCNLETAWAGLYLKSHSREKAAEDLRNFPARQLIDFDFPPVGGFHPYHELLEYRLRQNGVVLLKKQEAAENLHSALSEYLEILSQIPGMVTRGGE